jgi:hypothetical protein
MIYSPRMRPGVRAPRVNVLGRISVLVKLENGRQVSGKLQTVSVSGGLVQVPTYLEERTKIILTIPVGINLVRPHAETLFPMRSANGYLQPFRFTRICTEERQMLETEIAELLKQTAARSTATLGTGVRPRSFYLESF